MQCTHLDAAMAKALGCGLEDPPKTKGPFIYSPWNSHGSGVHHLLVVDFMVFLSGPFSTSMLVPGSVDGHVNKGR